MSRGSDGAAGNQKIYLTGFMGSGKSTVGRRLANDLSWAFVDLDETIKARVGFSIPRIFSERGESGFRELESRCLRLEAEREEPAVIATGGGAVLDVGNRQLMDASGLTFWLHPSFEVISARLSESSRAKRPLFSDEEKARALYRQRLPVYRTATHEIPVEADETASEVAARISFFVRGKSCDTW